MAGDDVPSDPLLVKCAGLDIDLLSSDCAGLITKQFFDTLTDNSALHYGIWGIISLLIGAALARIALIYIGFITDIHFRFRVGMMLRRNLLGHILKQPGARAIPCSPGEAISHFRDDVDQTEEAAKLVSRCLRHDLLCGCIQLYFDRNRCADDLARIPAARLGCDGSPAGYIQASEVPAASRESTSRVTGAISEMFSNVQADSSGGR